MGNAQKDTQMFEIHGNSSKGYWWRLVAANNEVLCHSEMYTTKQGAQNGVAAAKQIAGNATIFDRT